MIARIVKDSIARRLFKGKAILLVGARQVGKTTLIKEVLRGMDVLFLDADDPLVRTRLSTPNTKEIETIIGRSRLVFIDEAQRLENIGLTAKIIHDQFPDVQLVMSGSSAFELRNRTSEPLTGRKWEYLLYPISYEEYERDRGYMDALRDLDTRLVYGFYPDVINSRGEERAVLNELAQSYLYKDVLASGNVKKPEAVENVLRSLAFQVGNEVSYSEIAQLVGVDKKTVASYIRMLEMAYVIHPLTSFSRNLRNEIKTSRKIYFCDNGIRNALIQNFNPVSLRNDIGQLWENFLVSERLKRNAYHGLHANRYFWRTRQQQEIDYVEERDGEIAGFEFKWNAKAKAKIPSAFVEAYGAKTTIVNRENFREFVERS